MAGRCLFLLREHICCVIFYFLVIIDFRVSAEGPRMGCELVNTACAGGYDPLRFLKEYTHRNWDAER